MNHCTACKFFEKKVLSVGPPGSGQHALAAVCLHEKCAEPVTGDPLPCNFARQQAHVCGWQGKYYQGKPVEPPKREGNVIELP